MITRRTKYEDCSDLGITFGKWMAFTTDEKIYSTNRAGEGLFVRNYEGDPEVRQILGTGQFMPRTFARFKRKFYNLYLKESN